jgi:hypothetical protein
MPSACLALEERGSLELHADPRQQVGVARPGGQAQYGDLARVGLAQALDDLQRGGLAGPVGPQYAEELAGLDVEADPVDGGHVAVGLMHVADRDRGRHKPLP